MFRIFRYFSVAAFIGFCLAGTGLVWFYRTVTVEELVELGEQSNLAPAQTALNSVQPELLAYLESTSVPSDGLSEPPAMPEVLAEQIRQLMSGSKVQRIKIYGDDGRVVFSTRPGRLEREQEDNPGFKLAMNGNVVSKLVYRDTFNAFDEETEDDNLIQTYVPVREGPTKPIVGVFEIYTDVNELVGRAERLQIIVAVGVAVALGVLYGFLLYVVSRAQGIIKDQQVVIRDRSQSLEQLSAQLMTAQEAERKRIAEELHEGIAQTLSAVQIGIEDLSAEAAGHSDAELQAKAKRIMPVVQSAIGEVRKIAMDLRPSSLDDFGVVATIDWFCGQFQSVHMGVGIHTDLAVQEDEVSRSLKIIIFRIIQESLNYLVVDEKADDVNIGLERSGDLVALTLQGGSIAMSINNPRQIEDSLSGRSRLIALRERVKVSGGTLTENRADPEVVVLRMTWPA